MIWIILFYLSLVIIYITRGVEQGIMWSLKGAEAFKWNEHMIIAIARIATGVGMIVAVLLATTKGFWCFFFTGLVFLPSFWWWHNTSYYFTRHKIDSTVYKDWLTAKSETSTANINIGFKIRLIGLIVSIIGLVIIIFLF